MSQGTQHTQRVEVAQTFASLEGIFEQSQCYLSWARNAAMAESRNQDDPTRRMLLLAVSETHARLSGLMAEAMGDVRNPNRFFQVVPKSIPRSQSVPPWPPPGEPPTEFMTATRSNLGTWARLCQAMALQCPPGCRTKEVLLDLGRGFTAAQRRLWQVEVEFFDY